MEVITRFITKATLGLPLLFTLGACAEEIDHSEDGDAWRDVDLDPEAIMNLADQERWEDGLEEFLDLACDEGGCQWVWARFEDVGLGGLLERLPSVPGGLDGGLSGRAIDDVQISTPRALVKWLTLKSICCVNTQDPWGDDEPFILVAGDLIWNANNMQNGDCRAINAILPIDNPTTVELWEQDPGTNDLIDSFVVSHNTPNGGHGEQLMGKGGHYTLFYSIN